MNIRHVISLAWVPFLLAACNDAADYSTTLDEGWMSFSEMTLDVEFSKAGAVQTPSVDDFVLTVTDSKGTVAASMTYAEFVSAGKKLTLLAGNYILAARSIAGDIPAATFDTPVYGIEKEFTVMAQKETSLGSLVCRLLQCKVTVSYSDEFLSTVTGDGTAVVSVSSGSSLTYNLRYNAGKPEFDTKAGYFLVNAGESTTMTVTFKGEIKGKSNKMVYKALSDIAPNVWRQVEFVDKAYEEGTADVIITIADIIRDEEIRSDVKCVESVIGPDPDAPKGDGGIKLESTCSYDITQPVIVPPSGQPFVLTMKATVPNKVSTFTVEVNSNNKDFVDAVRLINDGSNILDLVNPSAGAIAVFTTILPFPYGDKVKDKEIIDFDLSLAQDPILIFKGLHTFTMHVSDKKGYTKDISVELKVD